MILHGRSQPAGDENEGEDADADGLPLDPEANPEANPETEPAPEASPAPQPEPQPAS
jgi:hypothetical protein